MLKCSKQTGTVFELGTIKERLAREFEIMKKKFINVKSKVGVINENTVVKKVIQCY